MEAAARRGAGARSRRPADPRRPATGGCSPPAPSSPTTSSRCAAHLDTMMEHVRRAPPGTSVFPGRGLWATAARDRRRRPRRRRARRAVAAADGTLGMAAVRSPRRRGRRGRAGPARRPSAEAATTSCERAPGRGDRDRRRDGHRHCPAGAGARGGASATAGATRRRGCASREAFFAAGGYERIARRCRTLLGEAGRPGARARARGARSSRRRCGRSASPAASSTCSRWSPSGLSNRARSPTGCSSRRKTVERHLSSLFDRTGVRNRAALGRAGRAARPQDG